MPPVATPPPASVRRDFTINAALTKAYTKKSVVNGVETEQMFLSGIASSTVRDRHGDTMSAKAQASMLEQARGLTMFLNHDYDVPEDVLGTCEESNLLASTVAGEDLIDLEIICRVTGANPRAVQAWKIVQDGITLGFSIGGAITECEVDEENDDGESWCPPLIIDGIDLYEISICGIPANPRSYTDEQKALFKELGIPEADSPASTTNFAQEMRRGFVRSATRNPEVRKLLRKALPALRDASAPIVEPTPELAAPAMATLACSGCEWKKEVAVEDADQIARDHQDETEHVVERNDVAPATKDAADGDPAPLDSKTQAAVATAIGCLTKAMAHGMCSGSLEDVTEAHECLKGLLEPGEDDPNEDDPPADNEPTNDSVQNAAPPAVVAAAEAQAKLDELSAAIEKKRAELEQLDADAVKRAADVAAADAKRAELDAEASELQKKVDALNAQPAGRATVAASGDAAQRPNTLHDAERRLGAALSGAATPANPAQRPA
jgi:HK97 family phage prohead protease